MESPLVWLGKIVEDEYLVSEAGWGNDGLLDVVRAYNFVPDRDDCTELPGDKGDAWTSDCKDKGAGIAGGILGVW